MQSYEVLGFYQIKVDIEYEIYYTSFVFRSVRIFAWFFVGWILISHIVLHKHNLGFDLVYLVHKVLNFAKIFDAVCNRGVNLYSTSLIKEHTVLTLKGSKSLLFLVVLLFRRLSMIWNVGHILTLEVFKFDKFTWRHQSPPLSQPGLPRWLII